MILGLHCSVLRGIDGALAEAEALGVEAFQMLPYRRHQVPGEEELERFRKLRAKSRVKRLVVHSRFVPSLGSADEGRRQRSIALLTRELLLCRGLGGESFILHAGAYSPGAEAEKGRNLALDSIRRAWEAAGGEASILIENVPGGGRRMGGTLEELAALVEGLDRLGVPAGACLDTAHAWAAGYDLSSVEGVLKFLARVHRLVGTERVKAFHLNDSRALLGSMREHHAHWGEGYLGKEGLRVLLERPEFSGVLGLLETPKSPEADRRNLDFLLEIGGHHT